MWSKLPVLSTTQQFLFCILITWGFDKTADSPGGFGFASLMRSKLRLGAEVAGRAAMNLSRSKRLCAWSQRLLRSAQRRFFNNVGPPPSNRAGQGRLDCGAVNATTSAFPPSWLESRFQGIRSPSKTARNQACRTRPLFTRPTLSPECRIAPRYRYKEYNNCTHSFQQN